MNDRDKRISSAIDVLTDLQERLDMADSISRSTVRTELTLIKGYLEEAAMPPKHPVVRFIRGLSSRTRNVSGSDRNI